MKISSGKVINWKFAAKSGFESIDGIKAVTSIIIISIMLNKIIRYLNFNGNSPIMALDGIIKERGCYVNEGLNE